MKTLITSCVLWTASLGVIYWLTVELGLTGYQISYADNGKTELAASPVTRAYQDRLKEMDKRDRELLEKERELSEKSKLLKDQSARYESEFKRYEKLNQDLENRIVTVENKKQAQAKLEDEKAQRVDSARQAKMDVEAEKTRVEATRRERLTRLKDLYEKMEPKRASKILDDLEVALSCELIRMMKQERAADILSKMAPERARKITEILGNKKYSVSVNDVPLINPITDSRGGE